jgi:hypothetical protein
VRLHDVDVSFDLKFFRWLLSASEGFAPRSGFNIDNVDPVLLTYITDFRERVIELMGRNPFSSFDSSSFPGSAQIKTYLATQMHTNFKETVHRALQMFFPEMFDKEEEAVDEEEAKSKNVSVSDLLKLQSMLSTIEEFNAANVESQKRLFSITPIQKCRVSHIHLDTDCTLRKLASRLDLNISEIFSTRLLRLHEKVVTDVVAAIRNCNISEATMSSILNVIGIPLSDGMSSKELFEYCHDSSNISKEEEVFGLLLKPRANHVTLSLQTDGVSCSVTWNWSFQYPAIVDEVASSAPKWNRKKRRVSPPLPKGDSLPWWPRAKSVSPMLYNIDPCSFDRIVSVDPGKVYPIYGVCIDQPDDDKLQSVYDSALSHVDPHLPVVYQHVKYWKDKYGNATPNRTHPTVVKCLQGFTRCVSSYAVFVLSVLPMLYNPVFYNAAWRDGLAAKKMYRRGALERYSRKQRKYEQVWKKEICGGDVRKNILIVYGDAFKRWKNMGTKFGCGPGKGMFRFLKRKCLENTGALF